jgi:hypothetical protein
MHLAIAAFDGYEHMPSALNVALAPGLGVDRALRRVSFVFSGGTRGVGMLSINIFVLDLCFVASERSGGWVSPCALQRGEGNDPIPKGGRAYGALDGAKPLCGARNVMVQCKSDCRAQ